MREYRGCFIYQVGVTLTFQHCPWVVTPANCFFFFFFFFFDLGMIPVLEVYNSKNRNCPFLEIFVMWNLALTTFKFCNFCSKDITFNRLWEIKAFKPSITFKCIQTLNLCVFHFPGQCAQAQVTCFHVLFCQDWKVTKGQCTQAQVTVVVMSFSDFSILAGLSCGKCLNGWIYAPTMVYDSFFFSCSKTVKKETAQSMISIILEISRGRG